MNALLTGVRRRLRLAWGVATAEVVAPLLAGVALLLVLVGRFRPWSWPEPAALVLSGAAAVCLGLAVVALRIPMTVAARAADRGLATGDAFFTALELDARGTVDGPFPQRVRDRAARLAIGSRPVDAVPVRFHRRPLVVVAVISAAAVALAVTVNPQDAVRRRQAAEQRALDEEAAKLNEAAAELRRTPQVAPGQEAVARRLEELARQLAQAPNLAAGREALDAAARDLSSRISSDLLAEKAAVRGLDRSLGSTPLPGAGTGDAAAQLRAEAAALAGLTPEQRDALADRLAALSATQTAGNAEAASALAAAGAALRAGDNAGASSALM
ncbi:MAG TPA: hypothetical protein VHF91_03985, partial [Acidimicrobiales bacterium]|nr:hypothetical protein [Acidimicrobiales bacterium]